MSGSPADDVEFEVLSNAATVDSVSDDVFRIIAAAWRGEEALDETITALRSEIDEREVSDVE